jgi:hypothetical protein
MIWLTHPSFVSSKDTSGDFTMNVTTLPVAAFDDRFDTNNGLAVSQNNKLALRVLLVLLFLTAISAQAQSDEWIWQGGSKTVGQAAVYGTLGTPAATNNPGARDSEAFWTDKNGHIWLFGGEPSINNELNDLWEYNPSTKEWAWMGGSKKQNQPGVYGTKGTPAATNIPGARENFVNWIDSSGHIWIFGGWGLDSAGNSGDLNDLWEYNPSTKEWTWIDLPPKIRT